jgi:hypothetical protein
MFNSHKSVSENTYSFIVRSSSTSELNPWNLGGSARTSRARGAKKWTI